MTAAITIRGLRKTYPNGMQALRGLDLDVEQGDFFALLGPNGAGKSPAIGLRSSPVTTCEGQGSSFGHDLDTDVMAAKRGIGVVPQEFNLSRWEECLDGLGTHDGFYGIPASAARGRAE